MSNRKILLFGANGQVGHALQTALAPLGQVVCLTRAQLDLSCLPAGDAIPVALKDLVHSVQPDVIVNAAAYTAVDRAESDAVQAELLNASVPGWLARLAQETGACLVHYSTDYVFDGTKQGTYVETDSTNPQSVYGATKLQGELAVAASCDRHLIFRTSWVFGAHGGNFLKTMLKLGQERDALRIVSDQIGAPTTAELIARVTASVLAIMLDQQINAKDTRWGTYHLVAAGETSWFDYARYVFEKADEMGWKLKVTPQSITPIATADYPVAARRPLNSRLDTAKLREAFGIALPSWQVGVDDVLAALKD